MSERVVYKMIGAPPIEFVRCPSCGERTDLLRRLEDGDGASFACKACGVELELRAKTGTNGFVVHEERPDAEPSPSN